MQKTIPQLWKQKLTKIIILIFGVFLLFSCGWEVKKVTHTNTSLNKGENKIEKNNKMKEKKELLKENIPNNLKKQENIKLSDIMKFCKNLSKTEVEYNSKYDDIKSKKIWKYICWFNYDWDNNKKILIIPEIWDWAKINFWDFVLVEILVWNEFKNIKSWDELAFLAWKSLFWDYTILENFNVWTVINFYDWLTIKIKNKITKNEYLKYIKEYTRKREEKSWNYNKKDFEKKFDLHKEEILKYTYPNNYENKKLITTIHFFKKDKLLKHSNTDRELVYAIIYDLKLWKWEIINKNNFYIKIENNEQLDIEDIIKQIFISWKITIWTKISLREVYLIAIWSFKNIEIMEK